MKSELNWKRLFWRKIIWIDLGVLAHFLYYFSGRNSKIIENIYSRGIFSGLRWIWDFTLGLLPVAILYIFLLLSIIWLSNKIYQWIKNRKFSFPVSWRIKFLNTSLNLLAVIGFVVFSFYFLWGFNYNRISLERHLDLDIKPLDSAALTKEAELALVSAVGARQRIPGAAPNALKASSLPKNLESGIRNNLKKILEMMDYTSPGRIRIRQMWPGDILMRFHVSGIYIPFFGEGYTAGKLTPVEKPFTLAHEMAHGLGFADEGSANFLAYLACESSEEEMIKYSGRLAYWSYIAGELAAVSREEYQLLFERMPPGMIADLRSISQNWRQYRGTLAKIGEKINDRYLKSQGVEEGVKSYNRMIVLVAAWRQKQDKK